MGVLFDDGRCPACEPAVRVSLWPVLPGPVGRVPVGLSPAGLGRSAVGASSSTPSRATKAVDNVG
jgi:hypothetical protein